MKHGCRADELRDRQCWTKGRPVAGPAGLRHARCACAPRLGAARIYVCGITPYDVTHVGHAATFVWADVLAAVLGSTTVQATVCRNITDVDDVLIEAARTRGRHYDEFALTQ